MTIPTPSDFAKLQTQRKQQESEREAQIASLERRLEKSSSTKHESTVQKNRARFGSSKTQDSEASHSSRKDKERDTSSRSKAMKKHPAGKRLPKNVSSTPSSEKTVKSAPLEKKPFVRKPHLTQRLSDNEALLELQKSFPKTQHHNRSKKRTGYSSKKK